MRKGKGLVRGMDVVDGHGDQSNSPTNVEVICVAVDDLLVVVAGVLAVVDDGQSKPLNCPVRFPIQKRHVRDLRA